MLHWDRPFHTVRSGSFENGDIVWFPEGGLNASYNCVDRWAFKHPDKVSLSLSFPCSYPYTLGTAYAHGTCIPSRAPIPNSPMAWYRGIACGCGVQAHAARAPTPARLTSIY